MEFEIKIVPRSELPGIGRGKGKTFSKAEIQFIRNHPELSNKELGKKLGRTGKSVGHKRWKLGLKPPVHPRFWSKEEKEIVKKYYPDTDNDKILEMLPGRDLHGLYGQAKKLGVAKSEEYMNNQLQEAGGELQKHGAKHRFSKGHVPVNKGLKQEDYMTAEAIEKSKKTRFKKGNKPANTLFDGAVTIRRDSKGNQYMWIRLGEGEWQEYHRHQYEKHIGPIPDEHIVVFKNGNSLDPRPENLEAITRVEHRDRNSNYEKGAESLRKYWENNPHPARELTDTYVAGMLAGGDVELRNFIISENPELIKVARANYKLKRVMKNGRKKDKQNR